MTTELFNNLKELREMVNQSSQHTQRQLQAIEGSVSFIKYIVTLIVSLGSALVIAEYWIPASFLLMYLWTIRSVFSTKKSFQPDSIKEVRKAYKKYGKKTFDYGFVWVFRNLKPLIQALSTIYVISVVILIFVVIGIVHPDGRFALIQIIIPVITAILFVLPTFTLDNIMKLTAKGVISKSLNDFFQLKEKARRSKKENP